jgi:hypothetical protein
MRSMTRRPRFISPYRQQLLLCLLSPARRSVGAPNGRGGTRSVRRRPIGAYTLTIFGSMSELVVGYVGRGVQGEGWCLGMHVALCMLYERGMLGGFAEFQRQERLQGKLGSGREEAPAAAAAPGAGAHSRITATAASSARARGYREVGRIRGVGGSSVVAPPGREGSPESVLSRQGSSLLILFMPMMRPTQRQYSHTRHASCRAVADLRRAHFTCRPARCVVVCPAFDAA